MIKTILPPFVARYFWGDEKAQINMHIHKKYIIQTLLERGDEKSLAWLKNQTGVDSIKKALPSLSLSPKSAHFWKIYFS